MKKQVPVEQLRIGMYVCGVDRPWLDTPFTRHRFPIRDAAQLEQLARCCRRVWIDTARGLDVATPAPPPPEAATDRRALARAARLHHDAGGVLDTILADLRLGHAVDAERTRSVVRELTAGILRNPGALLLLTRLKNRDRYISRHAVDVCVLALLFGRHLTLNAARLEELGLAGLLHDIGKIHLPDTLLHRGDALDEEGQALLQRHPEEGRALLAAAPGIPPVVGETVWCHHERPDGRGYPRGLKGREIPLAARVVAVANAYSDLTAPAPGLRPFAPATALRALHVRRDRELDGRLVDKFIHNLGIYPAGSVVALSSGEVGVVAGGRGDRPELLLFLDGERTPYEPARPLNLAEERHRGLQVAKVLDVADYAPRLERLAAELLAGDAA